MRRLSGYLRLALEATATAAILLAAIFLGVWRTIARRAAATDAEREAETAIDQIKKDVAAGDGKAILDAWRKHRGQ